MKGVAICPHCNVRKELDNIDQSDVPMVCQKCGQVMILSTPELSGRGRGTGGQPHPAPQQGQQYQYTPHPQGYYYPAYYPYYQPYTPKAKRNNPAIVSLLMYMTGVFGLVFWLSYFLVGYCSGDMKLDTNSMASTGAFGFTVLMLISSVFSLYGGYAAKRGNYEVTLLSSILGIISFGYLIGSIFSLVALMITATCAEEFIGQPGQRSDAGNA